MPNLAPFLLRGLSEVGDLATLGARVPTRDAGKEVSSQLSPFDLAFLENHTKSP